MNTSALAALEATMKLGEINTAITPLTINAEGLRQFGFDPSAASAPQCCTGPPTSRPSARRSRRTS